VAGRVRGRLGLGTAVVVNSNEIENKNNKVFREMIIASKSKKDFFGD